MSNSVAAAVSEPSAGPLDFRQLAESASSGIWLVDSQMRTIYANPAVASMLQTTPDAMLGRALPEFMEPEELPLAQHYFDQRLRGLGGVHEFCFRRADGSPLWVMASCQPTMNEDGSVRFVSALLLDISSLHESRTSAAVIGANFDRLLAHSPYPIATVDAAGVILRVNRMFEQTFRMPAAAAIGQPVHTLVETDGSDWAGALGHGDTATYGVKVCHEDGSRRELQGIAMPLLEAGEGPASLHFFVEARARSAQELELISQRDELEQRVREKTAAIELQARGMELTMEGMAVLQGDYYVWMNDAHAGMYGWDPAPLIGKTWRELYTEPTQRWIESAVFPVLMRDKKWRGEIVGKKRDGSAVDIELSLTMTDDGVLVCCCRDISERKASDRRLAESMRALDEMNVSLQKANRMKDEFLACMSHELRTPLHSVIGIAELLSEGIAGPTTERQQVYLEQLLSSGRHLLALISDLLDVSKIEGGQLSLVKDTVPLQYVLDVSSEMVAKAAAENGVALSRAVVDPTLRLYVDERRMVQVIVNLLSNAVKFTERGGKVSVDVEETPAAVTISVRDTGVGIKPEDISQLFQAFKQLDSSLTRKEGGTGLGLYLVKRLTELHGGMVMVESTPGVGSCFRVVLPRSADTGAEGMRVQ